MKLKFAKTDERAASPKKAHATDACWDLTAISYNYVKNADVPYYNYEFGIALELPPGHVGLLFPRSSLCNHDLALTNCVGIIDESFRGSLSARFKSTHFKSELPQIYSAGERVVQLMIIKLPEIELEEVTYDQLSKTVRNTGGFGSSGR